mmetsp:Transcript_37429/g.102858  ORF Transcript_37429/g.102858 Transcript_37429/m.102858 type:complete len:231 (-) Transcript_37429:1248-1940(-)
MFPKPGLLVNSDTGSGSKSSSRGARFAATRIGAGTEASDFCDSAGKDSMEISIGTGGEATVSCATASATMAAGGSSRTAVSVTGFATMSLRSSSPRSRVASNSKSVRHPATTTFTCSASEEPNRSKFDTSHVPSSRVPSENTLPRTCSFNVLQIDLKRACSLRWGIRSVTRTARHVPTFEGQLPKKPRRLLRAKPWPACSMPDSMAWRRRQSRPNVSFRLSPASMQTART